MKCMMVIEEYGGFVGVTCFESKKHAKEFKATYLDTNPDVKNATLTKADGSGEVIPW